MSKNRVVIAALLFLAATCVKFALPARGAQMSEGLRYMMEQGMELREAAAYLGESVAAFRWAAPEAVEADAPAQSVKTEDRTAPDKPEAKNLPRALALSFQTPAQTISLQCSGQAPSPDAVERCATELAEEAKREALTENFLSAQSVYSGHALPDNVCCAAPELGITYVSPIDGLRSSGFGYRVHPVSGEVKFHYGTDFAANAGTDIACFADGTVTMAGEGDGYGKYVIVDHGICCSLYAHCSAVLVQPGEEVTAGQTIARVGETGLATGPHLHFELRQDGMFLNPEFYCGEG